MTACLQGGRALDQRGRGPWESHPCSSFLLPSQALPRKVPAFLTGVQACSSSSSSQSSLRESRERLRLGKAPRDTRSGVRCPQGCLHGARRGRRRVLGTGTRLSLLSCSRFPQTLRGSGRWHAPSVPVQLDKLRVHLERMHGCPWSDTNPRVSETHCGRDVPWAPRARQVLVIGVIFL